MSKAFSLLKNKTTLERVYWKYRNRNFNAAKANTPAIIDTRGYKITCENLTQIWIWAWVDLRVCRRNFARGTEKLIVHLRKDGKEYGKKEN